MKPYIKVCLPHLFTMLASGELNRLTFVGKPLPPGQQILLIEAVKNDDTPSALLADVESQFAFSLGSVPRFTATLENVRFVHFDPTVFDQETNQ